MPGTNLTRDEAATRAALLDVTAYTVDLDLTSATQPEATTFVSTTTLEFTCREPGAGTFADLVAPTVREITLNGRSLDPATAYADSRIALDGLEETNTLVVTADCAYSNTGEGLHRFVDPADDRVYLYSQFEVPDARRVFTTFEQPDLKAVFTFNVTAPSHWVVVSNAATPEPRPQDEQSGASIWRFPTTKRMSTYITAIVAGEYHGEFDTYEGKFGTIPLGHYCRQSLKEHMDTAELVKLTKQSFEWFEEQFDYPYPFGKYDQLYVPEYNAGAMENAGCVTLRDEYLPRSRQPRSFFEFRASVITHEMAHMWFGDLVTMKWWDDLWLNESFAEWACYWCEANATEFDDAWTGFANARKQTGYRADQLPSTHPIAADNVDLHAVEVNFDMITYAKGASVLKQLVAWVGIEPFLEGLRSYFKEWEYGNPEFKDLLATLEKSSGRELQGWAQEWLQTAGVNTLAPSFELDADGAYTAFAVSQTAHEDWPTLRRHRLGIGLYDEVDGRLVRRDYVEIDVEGASTEVPELVGVKQPALLLLNDEDHAYAKIRLDERSLATAIASLSTFEDSLPRALVWGAAWDMTRDGEMRTRDWADLVLANIGQETDAWAVTRIPASTALAINFYSDPAHRPELKATWETGLRELLLAAEPGSDHQLTFARSYAGAAHSDAARRRPHRPARRVVRGRRTGRRPGHALGADHGARQAGSLRRRRDRRRARGRQDHLGQGAGRRGPRRAADRGGQGRRVGRAPRPVDAQRDVARDRVLDLPLRPGGRARALPREVPRRVGDARRHAGLPQGLDDPRVRLPQAARVRGHPRPARRVARGQLGAQAGAALRRRGACRDRPGAGRPAARRALILALSKAQA